MVLLDHFLNRLVGIIPLPLQGFKSMADFSRIQLMRQTPPMKEKHPTASFNVNGNPTLNIIQKRFFKGNVPVLF